MAAAIPIAVGVAENIAGGVLLAAVFDAYDGFKSIISSAIGSNPVQYAQTQQPSQSNINSAQIDMMQKAIPTPINIRVNTGQASAFG